MTARRRTDIVIIFVALIFGVHVGYWVGKDAADHWYAHHAPSTCVTYPVQNEMGRTKPYPNIGPMILYAIDAKTCQWGYTDANSEGHMFEASCDAGKIKLIPPIKVRTAAPVAKIEKPPKTIIVPQCLELVPIGAAAKPTASVEEPK